MDKHSKKTENLAKAQGPAEERRVLHPDYTGCGAGEKARTGLRSSLPRGYRGPAGFIGPPFGNE